MIALYLLCLCSLPGPVKKKGQWPEGHLEEMRLKGMSDEEGTGSVILHGESWLQSYSEEKPRQAGRILGMYKDEQKLELCKG